MGISSEWRAAGLSDPSLWEVCRFDWRAKAAPTDEDIALVLVRSNGRLRELRIGFPVTVAALRQLKESPSIEVLSLCSANISGEELLSVLPPHLKLLKEVNISGCTVTAAQLSGIREALPDDAECDVDACTECAQVGDGYACCDSCGGLHCFDCTTPFCESCMTSYCTACADEHGVVVEMCDECSEWQCSECSSVETCKQCTRDLCNDCRDESSTSGKTCTRCSELICGRCIETSFGVDECSHCHAVICDGCAPKSLSRCPLASLFCAPSCRLCPTCREAHGTSGGTHVQQVEDEMQAAAMTMLSSMVFGLSVGAPGGPDSGTGSPAAHADEQQPVGIKPY